MDSDLSPSVHFHHTCSNRSQLPVRNRYASSNRPWMMIRLRSGNLPSDFSEISNTLKGRYPSYLVQDGPVPGI